LGEVKRSVSGLSSAVIAKPERGSLWAMSTRRQMKIMLYVLKGL
jgi:hypothetical protein